MKSAGAIYKTEDKTFLGVYHLHKDIYIKLPEELSNLPLVAHFSYQKKNTPGNINVFELSNDASMKDIRNYINIKKEISMEGLNKKIRYFEKKDAQPILSEEEISKLYSAGGQIVNSNFYSKLPGLAFADIEIYCGKSFSTGEQGIIKKVESILPKTKIERVIPKNILQGGKQWFTKQCKLEANIDFVDGCITNWVPGEGISSFDESFFTNYFYFLGGDCNICYAASKHDEVSKTIHEHDEKQLFHELRGGCKLEYGSEKVLGRPVEILRFGKRTESWTPYTEAPFMKTLELMTQTGTRGVIPTKFLPFDKEVANLLRKTNSTLLYSLDGTSQNKFERGALAHGSNNEWRIEQAIKYKEQGVNSMFYLLGNFYSPPQQDEIKILEIAEKNKIITQLLPIRFQGKRVAHEVTGGEWNLLKGGNFSFNQYSHPGNGCYASLDNGLVLTKFDSAWLKIIGNNTGNVKVCHHNDDLVYCGTCSEKPGFIVKNNNLPLEKTPKKVSKKKIEKELKEKYKGMKPLF